MQPTPRMIDVTGKPWSVVFLSCLAGLWGSAYRSINLSRNVISALGMFVALQTGNEYPVDRPRKWAGDAGAAHSLTGLLRLPCHVTTLLLSGPHFVVSQPGDLRNLGNIYTYARPISLGLRVPATIPPLALKRSSLARLTLRTISICGSYSLIHPLTPNTRATHKRTSSSSDTNARSSVHYFRGEAQTTLAAELRCNVCLRSLQVRSLEVLRGMDPLTIQASSWYLPIRPCIELGDTDNA